MSKLEDAKEELRRLRAFDAVPLCDMMIPSAELERGHAERQAAWAENRLIGWKQALAASGPGKQPAALLAAVTMALEGIAEARSKIGKEAV